MNIFSVRIHHLDPKKPSVRDIFYQKQYVTNFTFTIRQAGLWPAIMAHHCFVYNFFIILLILFQH